MKYSEKWGDSIESAVELALAELKLSKDQVKVTILEEPSKGFFGIGAFGDSGGVTGCYRQPLHSFWKMRRLQLPHHALC